MPYAVTLPLDDAAAAHVRRMWSALSEQAGADDAIRLGYEPHITLAVLPDALPVADVEHAACRAAASWTVLPVALAGFGIFPGATPVIWVAPIVTADLLAIHASLHADLAPLPVDPHYRPGFWMPHVTLSQEGMSSTARMIEIASSVWHGPISAYLKRIELVRFRPVKVLRSQVLQSGK